MECRSHTIWTQSSMYSSDVLESVEEEVEVVLRVQSRAILHARSTNPSATAI